MHEQQDQASVSPRVGIFDTLRGFTIISMVCFHAAYDAVYLYGIDMPWFRDPVIQDVWRCSISWVFIFLAGWMTRFSRNNLKRAAVYGLAALAVFIATTITRIDTPVTFGILFCMAACTFCYAMLSQLLERCHPAWVLAAAIILFALTYQVPRQVYPIEGLAWLGIPSPTFTSGDYYPLIPYVFLYCAGASGARLFDRLMPGGYPSWMRATWVPALAALGRLSLVVYLIHQPLLIGLFTLFFGS